MATFTAIYDACVLYPAVLRDLLMRLPLTDLYRARWTTEIQDEWSRNLLANRSDIDPNQIERTKSLMNEHTLDCLVTGYDSLIEGLDLPDPNDRHVLAAAIRTRANVIVTFNLSDFPSEYLAQYGIEPQHPDEFLTHLLDLAPGLVCDEIKQMRSCLVNPPISAEELIQSLHSHQLPHFASHLSEFTRLI